MATAGGGGGSMGVLPAATSDQSGRIRTSKKRLPKICITSGHYQQIGLYVPQHISRTGRGCGVDMELKRPEQERTGRKSDGGLRRFSPCSCTSCAAALAAHPKK